VLLGGDGDFTRDDIIQLAQEKPAERRKVMAELLRTGSWPRPKGKKSQPAKTINHSTGNVEAPAEDTAAQAHLHDAEDDVTGANAADKGGVQNSTLAEMGEGTGPAAQGPQSEAAEKTLSDCSSRGPQAASTSTTMSGSRDAGHDVEETAGPKDPVGLDPIIHGEPEEAADLVIRLRGRPWALALGQALIGMVQQAAGGGG
jgi:hypothetical protein